ncbi:ATP-binding protein [Thioalkalivibrio nitratireducens]
MDRLIHHAHVIELSGESYRKKTHKRDTDEDHPSPTGQSN